MPEFDKSTFSHNSFILHDCSSVGYECNTIAIVKLLVALDRPYLSYSCSISMSCFRVHTPPTTLTTEHMDHTAPTTHRRHHATCHVMWPPTFQRSCGSECVFDAEYNWSSVLFNQGRKTAPVLWWSNRRIANSLFLHVRLSSFLYIFAGVLGYLHLVNIPYTIYISIKNTKVFKIFLWAETFACIIIHSTVDVKWCFKTHLTNCYVLSIQEYVPKWIGHLKNHFTHWKYWLEVFSYGRSWMGRVAKLSSDQKYVVRI